MARARACTRSGLCTSRRLIRHHFDRKVLVLCKDRTSSKLREKKKCGPYTSTYVISIAIIQDQQTQVTHGYTRTFRCVTRTVSYSRGQASGLTHTIVEASIVRKLYSRFVSANAIPLSAASLQFLSFFSFSYIVFGHLRASA